MRDLTPWSVTCAGIVALGVAVLLPGEAGAAWRPGVEAAQRYAKGRPGVVSFSVQDGRRAWGYRARRSVAAVSLMKPMLMAAYLRRPEVRRRALRPGERRMLAPMIRRSDNEAAERVRDVVGIEGQLAVARRARMRDFTPYTVWGLSRTSARDQASFFRRLPRLLPRRHRAYGMRLLRTIVPSQRWGIARAAPDGWRLHFKGGWGSGRGLADHQAALLARGRRRIGIAITTTGSGSQAAGNRTLEGVARRLLRGL